MHSITRTSYSGRIRGSLVLLLAISLALPALLFAHIRLEQSSPGRDEVLSAPPSQLRLLFSARIEERYTTLAVLAPDGRTVALGPVVFIAGSDRDITVQLPPLHLTGAYHVRWRTAGADGHVLEGSYAFTLALDSALAAPPQDTTPAPAVAMDGHAEHAEPESAAGTSDTIGRGLHFLALLFVLGAVAFRVLLLPRLGVAREIRAVLELRAWRTLAVAAVLLGAAAVLRLWLQSIALHGAERAWNTALLSIMLTDTGWGRGWLLQAFLFALLGMAIAWARPGRDGAALFLVIPTVLGLAAIPALTGHAAGATGTVLFAVANDIVHVSAAGAWLGTLAVLMLAAMPVIRRYAGTETAADTVHRFSPIALTSAAIVTVTGVINAVLHMNTPSQLWTTVYGRTLLVKVALVTLIIVMGFVNWRVIRPMLRYGSGMSRFRWSAAAELLFAVLVLCVTAVLTGQPRP